MATLDDLIQLGRWRWATAVLAFVAERGGARFVEMLNTLDVPRESLSRTLEGAIAAGWLRRNPGHGHPLRPEHVLTPAGERLGALARSITLAQRRLALGPETMTRWSLPIVRSVSDGHTRFNDISRTIAAASPRALSQSLKGLSDQSLLRRALIDGFPPASAYTLTRSGLVLAAATKGVRASQAPP